MTAQRKIEQKDSAPVAKTGLALLRQPFADHQISKLPKPTKRQTEEVRNDFKKGIRCKQCGQWHHPDVQHLDYVGHAALTDRLLDCDPNWNWEPMAFTENGLPVTDDVGGMWIKLTVCGQTRFGYGHAEGKRGGDAVKEVIGDALRNAAMRFGAALDLWHKGDLHGPSDAPTDDEATQQERQQQRNTGPDQHQQPRDNGPSPEAISTAIGSIGNADSMDQLRAIWSDLPKPLKAVPNVLAAKNKRKGEIETQPQEKPLYGEILADEIPY